jgi:hypothetical protein
MSKKVGTLRLTVRGRASTQQTGDRRSSTPGKAMIEPSRAQHLLQRLADLGVRISIDDFGVGYTSLAQLKNLPVSELKIDQSFVMTMTEDHSNAVIVHGVVDLGHNSASALSRRVSRPPTRWRRWPTSTVTSHRDTTWRGR